MENIKVLKVIKIASAVLSLVCGAVGAYAGDKIQKAENLEAIAKLVNENK